MPIDIQAQPLQLPHFIRSPSSSVLRESSSLYPPNPSAVSLSHFPAVLNSGASQNSVPCKGKRAILCFAYVRKRDVYTMIFPPSVLYTLLFPLSYWHWWRRRRCCRRRRSSGYGSKLPASYCWIYTVDHSSHVWAPRRYSTTTPPK